MDGTLLILGLTTIKIRLAIIISELVIEADIEKNVDAVIKNVVHIEIKLRSSYGVILALYNG
ncbi:allantoin permease, partial [Salmonella enterica subsp. enterica serovar Infantis]